MDSLPGDSRLLAQLGFELRNIYVAGERWYGEIYAINTQVEEYIGSTNVEEFINSLMSCAISCSMFHISGQFYIDESSLIFRYTSRKEGVDFEFLEGHQSVLHGSINMLDFCSSVGSIYVDVVRTLIKISGNEGAVNVFERPDLYLRIPL